MSHKRYVLVMGTYEYVLDVRREMTVFSVDLIDSFDPVWIKSALHPRTREKCLPEN